MAVVPGGAAIRHLPTEIAWQASECWALSRDALFLCWCGSVLFFGRWTKISRGAGRSVLRQPLPFAVPQEREAAGPAGPARRAWPCPTGTANATALPSPLRMAA